MSCAPATNVDKGKCVRHQDVQVLFLRISFWKVDAVRGKYLFEYSASRRLRNGVKTCDKYRVRQSGFFIQKCGVGNH
jgi:hypothetical protein